MWILYQNKVEEEGNNNDKAIKNEEREKVWKLEEMKPSKGRTVIFKYSIYLYSKIINHTNKQK